MLSWKIVLEILEYIDSDINKADELMSQLPPGEPWNQEALTDQELKQQILSHAPNVEAATRSVKELFLRKDRQLKDLIK